MEYITLILIMILIILIIILILQSFRRVDRDRCIHPSDNQTEELVVSICYENVDWIDKYASNYDKVTVYNKCEREVKFNSNNVIVVNLENIGSCDYAFLTYIINNYENLPDFIEFCKGSSTPNRKYYECLVCGEYPSNLLDFTIPYYTFQNNKTDHIWVKSNYGNLGNWLKDTTELSEDLFKQNSCNIIYGGHFGVTKYQILRNSIYTYKKIKSYQKYPNEEVDHYIERIWRPLLCKPKYFLVVVAIFKNEKNAMKEWLTHHTKQGVEHFYLINNGSTDEWESEILDAPVTIVNDNTKHQQANLYNKHFFNEVKINSEWVMVIDLDEFVYARKDENISSSIKKYYNIDVIKLRWKMFGTNGHIKQPNSIIDGFTKRKKMIDDNHSGHVKSIVKSRMLKKFRIHEHETYNCTEIFEPPIPSENSLSFANLQLNHYVIQSKDWFFDVKMTRGDASNVFTDNFRDLDYFNKYDTNEITDNELSENSIENFVQTDEQPNIFYVYLRKFLDFFTF